LPSRNRKCGKTLFGEAEVLAVAYPKLKDTVPAQFADVESKPFYRAVNTVDLGQFIRIKADEATYNLILYCASNWNSNYYRKLKVADLPAAWSARLGPVLWHRPTAQ